MAVQAILVFFILISALELPFNLQGGHFFIESLFVQGGSVIFGSSSTPISPISVGLIILSACVLLILIGRPSPLLQHSVVQSGAVVAALISTLVSFTFVLSYLYGSPFLYGTQYIPLAITSAIAAFFIGAGVVTATGENAIPPRYLIGNTTRARLLRTIVPLVVVVIFLQNIAFYAHSLLFSVHNALLLSASLVIFAVLTVGVIARISNDLGRALDLSEDALVRKNEDLNALNEELTATQEELHQNLDELVRAQQEIRKNEEKFRTIADFTSDWEYWVSTDNTFRYISPSCKDVTGYSAQEFMDNANILTDIVHPEDRARFSEHQNLCQHASDSQTFDYRIIHRDGGVRWISHKCKPVFSGDHSALGRRVSNRDITERKKAEEALQETSQYLENLIGYANSPIIVWDPQFRITRFNHAFERLTGRTAGEVIGKTLGFLFPDAYREASMALITRAQKGEWLDVVEIPILHVNGEIRTVLWNSATLFREDRKTVLSTIAQGQDITDRKIAEEKNLRAREEWERTFNTVPDLIAILDADHRILRLNHSMAEHLNKAPEECVGMLCHEAVHGTSVPPEFCPHAATCKDGKQHIVEVHEPALGGYFIVSTTPLYDSERRLIGSVHVAHDITEYKRIEDELRKIVAELKRSNQDLEQFAYVASHDLQEPLRNVTLFSQLFIKKYGDAITGEGKEYLDFVIEGSTRMSTLIHDLLDFSRVNTRGEPFIPVDMNDAVEDSCTNLQALIQESGSTVTYDTLPVVRADPLQIRQVLQNLIDNAIKYRSTDPPLVHIGAMHRDNEWIFSVKDNGIGIAPEYHEKIFQLFKRLHTRQKYSGTGIGLALVKKIIERHSGRIWVESEEGKGTTFQFTLPAG